MSRTLQLRLAYNGERFSGWQIQPDQRTVQGVLSDAIQNVSGERSYLREAVAPMPVFMPQIR